MRRAAHKTLNSVSQKNESLRYNVAVAQIYEFATLYPAALGQVGGGPRLGHSGGARAAGADDRPNAAAFGGEDCWERLGYNTLLADQLWPQAEGGLAR